MSFWNTSDGQKPEASGSFETGGDIDPMPNNTAAISMPTEAKWDEYKGERYISIRWDVVDGEYKNRVTFHKVKVLDKDPKKADKAKRMLAAIDANAGGQLMKIDAEPTDMQLASALCNKPMMVVYRTWEMTRDAQGKEPGDRGFDESTATTRRGNWVSAVQSSSSKPKPQQTQQQAPANNVGDEDIGF